MNKPKKTQVEIKKTGFPFVVWGAMVVVAMIGIAVALFRFSPVQEAYAVDGRDSLPEITVYKSPTCGCCTDWEVHLEKEGFKVISHKERNMNRIKKSLGVKSHLASCHTAVIDGYVIEGHVPANDIKRLLKERPPVAGLTAPGMPQHSPGMQPPGERPRGYSVLTFDKEGRTRVFTRY